MIEDQKTISVQCEGAHLLDIDEIEIFQGSLKSLSDQNYEKLKKSILELGFSAPFFIWDNDKHNWLMDGTQRKVTLHKMREEGFKIPKLPCVKIFAKSKKEAAQKLLAIVSQFGKVGNDGLLQFSNTFDLNLLEIRNNFELPEVNFDYLIMPESANGKEFTEDVEFEVVWNECPKCGNKWPK